MHITYLSYIYIHIYILWDRYPLGFGQFLEEHISSHQIPCVPCGQLPAWPQWRGRTYLWPLPMRIVPVPWAIALNELMETSLNGRTSLEISVNICELEISPEIIVFSFVPSQVDLKSFLRLLSHGGTEKLLPWQNSPLDTQNKRPSSATWCGDAHPEAYHAVHWLCFQNLAHIHEDLGNGVRSYIQLLSTGLRYPHAACELKIMDCRPLPPSQPRTITSSRGWKVESPSSNRSKMILT